jgi:hypothetical protein
MPMRTLLVKCRRRCRVLYVPNYSTSRSILVVDMYFVMGFVLAERLG